MALVFIASATASGSATLEFTSGIDSTYNEYQFQFVNMHAANDGTVFEFQVNTGFNQVITSTAFYAYHHETSGATALSYHTGADQAQTQLYQRLNSAGADNDQALAGILTLYAPSSPTYVKHFTSNSNTAHDGDYSYQLKVAGYINTTSAIDKISFKMSSGNIDAGTIYMYGVG